MKTEKTFWAIFIVVVILKLLNVPGHGLLACITLGGLGMLYFPGAFYFFCDKQIKRQNIALSIVSGFFLSYIPIAILFKLQHYPGQKFMIIIGLIIGVVIFILTYFLRRKSKDDLKIYYRNMFLRTLVLAVAIVFFTLLPSKIIYQLQYRNDPERVRLLNKIDENPDNNQYYEDLLKYIHKKDSFYFQKDK